MSQAEMGPAASASNRLGWLLWVPPVVFLSLFFFYPLSSILGLSFARQEGGWAAAFTQALAAPGLWRVLGFTLGRRCSPPC